ncbi:unnamed protein product [Acanthoscelides obtectus]|uniref:HAT C-terminal dimerisation domain-containing protein n=1 Tax=Acanthoscelides obtectus TaxID=200917 RepID=A0A9P0M0Z6_ACAOB|nr:unnamed protein product [Acanthoscelides obtectus]CAK1649454.1 Zinc finger MYM-type protein 1 [Acanthoscelides obtectus]
MNRPNIVTCDKENHYRLNLYVPLLDNILQDLVYLINEESSDIYNFNIFFASVFNSNTEAEVMDILETISKYLRGLNSNENKNLISTRLEGEFDLWKSRTQDIIDSGMSLYLSCDENIFPSINRCLQLLISLPVTVATSERSFSHLKRLKTWLRSTMLQERLVGLALLYMHRNIKIGVNKIIDRFANKKNRRLDFVI